MIRYGPVLQQLAKKQEGSLMVNFILKSMVRRMVLLFLALGLTCFTIGGYITFGLTTQLVQEAEYQKLASLNEAQAGVIRDYIRSSFRRIDLHVQNNSYSGAFSRTKSI